MTGQRALIWSSFRSRVFAHDVDTGDAVWEYKLASSHAATTLLVARQVVFVGSQGYFYALDAQTGREVWTNPMKGKGAGFTHMAISRLDPTSKEDPLYALSGLIWVVINRRVFALRRSDGHILWEHNLATSANFFKASNGVALVLLRKTLIVGMSGYLFGLDGVTGDVLWTNPMKGKGIGIMSLAVIDEDDTAQTLRSTIVQSQQQG